MKISCERNDWDMHFKKRRKRRKTLRLKFKEGEGVWCRVYSCARCSTRKGIKLAESLRNHVRTGWKWEKQLKRFIYIYIFKKPHRKGKGRGDDGWRGDVWIRPGLQSARCQIANITETRMRNAGIPSSYIIKRLLNMKSLYPYITMCLGNFYSELAFLG